MNFPLTLLGGALIGLAVTLMLAFNGRVTGISGIINQSFSPPVKNSSWRFSFILGLLCGGVLVFLINPLLFSNASGRDLIEILAAGFLVGFGSILGGGCTSGHGVCGVSRLSIRSVIATGLFILAGAGSVAAIRWMGWTL